MVVWSLSRERLFAECPLAFYLHRVASEKGALEDAPAMVREWYARRRLQWSHHYARKVVSTAVRDFFLSGQDADIAGSVRRRVARERHAALRGETGAPQWLDPENVGNAVEDLLRSPYLPRLMERLKRVHPIEKVRLPEVCRAELAGVELCAAPILAWREERDCVFLLFESHESVDTVLCRWALEHLKLGPDRVRFLRWDGREEPAMRLGFSTELDHILASAARMYAGPYPATGDRSRCARCRFRGCCGA